MEKKQKQNILLYPDNIEEKLGFDKVREYFEKYCATDMGRQSVHSIAFMNNREAIKDAIAEVLEMNVLSAFYMLQFTELLSPVAGFLQKLEKEGMMLYEDELLMMFQCIQAMQANRNAIVKHSDALPRLNNRASSLTDLSAVIQILDKVIDREGRLRPDASPALAKISKDIAQGEREVRRVLMSRYEYARKNGWAGDTEITIRNERLVIPVIAEFKKKVPGFVHDDSQSGKFLYIEPLECFEANNALKELYIERKKEIEAILRKVTADISPYRQQLWQHIQFTTFLDITRAKSVFSSDVNATEPAEALKNEDVRLVNARHPILYLLLRKDNKQLVPLNFHVDEDCHMVVVSGPNAGGKSIALKTIGLLQYMYQCGLPVPLEAGSRLPVYNHIFIDIGDNQSIENNLSSYSSHLMNMKYFMQHADSQTLYLIDELGNGTDPSIGSTIAQAILEALSDSKAFGVVTTHFGNLKAWAGQTEGVQNARMAYDVAALEPLFKMELGKPGSSFALEVAGKVGVQKQIIDRAKKINRWKQHIDLEELLAENEKNKLALAEANKRTAEREKKLEKLIEEYNELKNSLTENKHKILNEAKLKAGEIVSNANKKIENTIREIKESKADKQHTNKVRKELAVFNDNLKVKAEKPDVKTEVPTAPKEISKPLKEGEMVRQNDNNVSGEILTIKGNKAHVLFGIVKMWVPLADLQRTTRTAEKKSAKQLAVFNTRLFEKQSNFSIELDLRGVRGEEAMQKLEQWLEDAHLLGHGNLKIIHGRGFGILRKLIHEYLRKTPFVKNFEHENEQLGGDGVTLVRLK